MIEEINRHEGKPLRFFRKEYISEFVYGGIDGAITTFAVVAGATGAHADLRWVLIFWLRQPDSRWIQYVSW